jgi:NDP-sugar pyrophosphorylase family protein
MQFPNKPDIDPQAKVDPSARISGPVIIEEGTHIYEYAIIKGPCYIGKNAVVGSYCKVRKETVLEEGVELQNSVDVKHSIIGQGTHVHSGFIGDSIIGENVRIGANFITANRRLDRKKVRVLIKGKMVDTRSSFFGSLIGDKAKIGIHCGTNPGVVIPEDSVVAPGTIVTN